MGVKSAFNLMRFIVSVGWSIYPLGYFFGYLMGAVSDSPLNLIYNLADFVNKIWFCLAIWNAAKKETQNAEKSALKEGLLLFRVREMSCSPGELRSEAFCSQLMRFSC